MTKIEPGKEECKCKSGSQNFTKAPRKKDIQEKMCKHISKIKMSFQPHQPKKKVALSPHLPIMGGVRTRAQTYSDTGIKFWSKSTDYKLLIIDMQAQCRALITCAHTCTSFLLIIDPQAVACRCFAEEFITSVMHCCVVRRHKHTT